MTHHHFHVSGNLIYSNSRQELSLKSMINEFQTLRHNITLLRAVQSSRLVLQRESESKLFDA